MTVTEGRSAGETAADPSDPPLTTMQTFECAEARVGYYLFSVWGIGICAVFGAGTGGVGATVCSLVLAAGGGEIDFNSVCD